MVALSVLLVVAAGAGRAEDKAHRLRRALMVTIFLYLVVVWVVPLELRVEGLFAAGQRGAIWLPVAFAGVVLAAFTLAYVAVHPVISRLRGLRPETRTAARRQLRMLAVFLLPLVVYLVILRVARSELGEGSSAIWLVVAAWLMLMVLVAPFLVRLALPTRPMPSERRERLAQLCRRQGGAGQGYQDHGYRSGTHGERRLGRIPAAAALRVRQ